MIGTHLAGINGQLVLKCPFGVFKPLKKQQKVFQDFCPSL
jgi:hypothetical protein